MAEPDGCRRRSADGSDFQSARAGRRQAHAPSSASETRNTYVEDSAIQTEGRAPEHAHRPSEMKTSEPATNPTAQARDRSARTAISRRRRATFEQHARQQQHNLNRRSRAGARAPPLGEEDLRAHHESHLKRETDPARPDGDQSTAPSPARDTRAARTSATRPNAAHRERALHPASESIAFVSHPNASRRLRSRMALV